MTFKVGDRVEVMGDTADWGHEVTGRVGIITGSADGQAYDSNEVGWGVDVAGDVYPWDVAEKDLKLVDEEPVVASDDPVDHPSHYTWGPVEVIEITERLGFCLGNVIKYVLRADHKGKPIEDLSKAAWYLSRELERRKAEQ